MIMRAPSVLYSPADPPCSLASVPLSCAIDYEAGSERKQERSRDRALHPEGHMFFSFYQASQAGDVRNTKGREAL